MKLQSLTALSLSIGLLAGIATYLAVGPLSGIFLIWAATIAWAAYFALGANAKALRNTIVCGIFGVFMAWVTAIEITFIPSTAALGFPFLASLAVAVSVVALCLAANLPELECIPASVLGYSSTFAFLLQTPDKLNREILLSVTLHNPLIVISISFAVGAVFGLWSGKLSAQITQDTF